MEMRPTVWKDRRRLYALWMCEEYPSQLNYSGIEHSCWWVIKITIWTKVTRSVSLKGINWERFEVTAIHRKIASIWSLNKIWPKIRGRNRWMFTESECRVSRRSVLSPGEDYSLEWLKKAALYTEAPGLWNDKCCTLYEHQNGASS